MPSSTTTARESPTQIPADLHETAHRLHEEFDERLDPRVVDQSMVTIAATFADARIRSYVPLLVRRYVSEDLHARIKQAA